MSRTKRLAASVTTAAALATLLSTSAFAESRNQNGTWRDNRDDRGSRQSGYRDNERVTVQGRVQRFRQERDGYRVNLDRNRYSYRVPSSHIRNRGRGLRVGINIRLGGVFRGGSIHVDNVGWPDDGYRDDYVRGVVERVDLRRGTLVLRDDNSGRYITVDMRRSDRRWDRSIDLSDLRRGDYVSLSGDWCGVFTAYRIENVRSSRRD